jgi:hypothetical protein
VEGFPADLASFSVFSWRFTETGMTIASIRAGSWAQSEVNRHWLMADKIGQIRGVKYVQKKLNNLLTGPWIFAILGAHTVNTYT